MILCSGIKIRVDGQDSSRLRDKCSNDPVIIIQFKDFSRLRGKWSNDQVILVDDCSSSKILEDWGDSSRLRGKWLNDPVILCSGINQTGYLKPNSLLTAIVDKAIKRSIHAPSSSNPPSQFNPDNQEDQPDKLTQT